MSYLNMVSLFTVSLLLVIMSGVKGLAQDEPLLKELPPGLMLESSTVVPSAQVQAIGQKLGGKILQLSNSVLRVHGAPIQVNIITAADQSQAATIHNSLLKIKAFPFVVQNDHIVVEYVGKNLGEAVAIKTSYELGIIAKPKSIRYQVTAELATIEKADYMNCNALFNHFLTLEQGRNQQVEQQIRDLSKSFTFGNTLVLRNPNSESPDSKHQFAPTPFETTSSTWSSSYKFREPELRYGVPFVTATMEITVNDTALRNAKNDLGSVAATRHWPADHPKLVGLAKQITAGKNTNEAKVQAILRWLTPGKNVKYSGQTGSRWGTLKVLEQEFGHCWDFSDCFVSLARASGVPSRQVAGWLYGSSGHVWAEYHVEGKGWQQVDPTGGGQIACGIYHIPYFASDDGEMPIVYTAMPQITILKTN